jgi:hypothetical protein
MSFHRARPPRNRQNLDDSCWAAALDSFSRITAAQLGLLTTALSAHGVNVDLLPILSMPYDIEDRLRRSHVILGRHLGGSDWHAWLIYSVDNWLSYMDPRDGAYHSIHWASSGFVSPRGWYLFWKP